MCAKISAWMVPAKSLLCGPDGLSVQIDKVATGALLKGQAASKHATTTPPPLPILT